MILWIRSQDKKRFIKCKCIILKSYSSGYSICEDNTDNCMWVLGNYKTRKRALEVLDDIQNKIQNQYLLKPKGNIKPDMMQDAKTYFENLNGVKIVTCDNFFELSPINANVVVYEMPKE